MTKGPCEFWPRCRKYGILPTAFVITLSSYLTLFDRPKIIPKRNKLFQQSCNMELPNQISIDCTCGNISINAANVYSQDY